MPLALLARREADRLRHADFGVGFADDLGPAGDHARLHEPEAAERGAADLRDQFGNRLSRPPRGRSIRASPRRLRAGGFLRPGVRRVPYGCAGHAIGARGRLVSLARDHRHLLAWYDGHARTLPWRVTAGRGAPPDPYRVWLSRSCSSRPPPRASRPIAPSSSRAGPRWRHSPPRPRRTSWPSGQGSDTTRALAT